MRRFVADASHELRTPLAAVAAYAELFERGADAPARRPRPGRCTASRRERPDGRPGRRPPAARPPRRGPSAANGSRSTRRRWLADAVADGADGGPAWPIRLDAQHPVEVIGDAGRLRQVVDNLLANVRAHTPAGHDHVDHVADER